MDMSQLHSDMSRLHSKSSSLMVRKDFFEACEKEAGMAEADPNE